MFGMLLLQSLLQEEWTGGSIKPNYEIYELYRPNKEEAFALIEQDLLVADWTEENFSILDENISKKLDRSTSQGSKSVLWNI